MVSCYAVLHPIPHGVQYAPLTARLAQSCPASYAGGVSNSDPDACAVLTGQSGHSVVLAFSRPFGSVSSGFRPCAFPVRLFEAQVDPTLTTESSTAPAVFPGSETFGTTKSGVRFGIDRAATQD